MTNHPPGPACSSLSCPACPASSAFCHRPRGDDSGALDDGTREGGEPILLDDEACLIPLSSN